MNPPQVYMCSLSWTHFPPPSPSPPSGSSQCTSPKHPVLCIEPGLAVCFTYDKYTCFSAILPNHPTLALSHRVQKTVLYIFVSLLSHIQGYRYHLSEFYIYALLLLYWCFSFWLTSLCIIGSSFIHLIRTDSNVFFLKGVKFSQCVKFVSFLRWVLWLLVWDLSFYLI